MAEVLVSFNDPVTAPNGSVYTARACGGEMDDGRWQGWIEFEQVGGPAVLRSPRETTQPNRTDTEYWATGLTAVYLEGALDRALRPAPRPVVNAPELAAFDEPLPSPGADAPRPTDAVLNPYSVYRKGEALLRRQLMAFERWHLVNIITAYELSDLSEGVLNQMTPQELIEVIVTGVRETSEA